MIIILNGVIIIFSISSIIKTYAGSGVGNAIIIIIIIIFIVTTHHHHHHHRRKRAEVDCKKLRNY